MFKLITYLLIIYIVSGSKCNFSISGKDSSIEFKGKVLYNGIFNYLFSKDIYCIGNWIMKSSNDNDNYKLEYNGAIKNGMPHGVGQNTMITHSYGINNDTQAQYLYTGGWVNGYKEGNGLLNLTFINQNTTNNLIQKGKFEKNNIIVGFEFIYSLNNNVCSVYNGKFKDNRPNGYGIINYNNGTSIEGEFVNGNIININNIFESKINEFDCLETLIQVKY
jgi:hypothetical protein